MFHLLFFNRLLAAHWPQALGRSPLPARFFLTEERRTAGGGVSSADKSLRGRGRLLSHRKYFSTLVTVGTVAHICVWLCPTNWYFLILICPLFSLSIITFTFGRASRQLLTNILWVPHFNFQFEANQSSHGRSNWPLALSFCFGGKLLPGKISH